MQETYDLKVNGGTGNGYVTVTATYPNPEACFNIKAINVAAGPNDLIAIGQFLATMGEAELLRRNPPKPKAPRKKKTQDDEAQS